MLEKDTALNYLLHVVTSADRELTEMAEGPPMLLVSASTEHMRRIILAKRALDEASGQAAS